MPTLLLEVESMCLRRLVIPIDCSAARCYTLSGKPCRWVRVNPANNEWHCEIFGPLAANDAGNLLRHAQCIAVEEDDYQHLGCPQGHSNY
jgi:hypothetical protein